MFVCNKQTCRHNTRSSLSTNGINSAVVVTQWVLGACYHGDGGGFSKVKLGVRCEVMIIE